MSVYSHREVKRKFFPSFTISSLVILIMCLLNNPVLPVTGSADNQQGSTETVIELLPSSLPRFFDCGETRIDGAISLAGLNADDSAQSALTDGDLNTIIMGKAIFDVSNVNSSIVNIPGPDLIVVEMHNPEPINASIPDFDTGGSKVESPTPSNNTDIVNCRGWKMNQAFVDLNNFGIPEGSAVPSIRLDNNGFQGTLNGSDIAEVILPKPTTLPGSNPGTIPFLRTQ
jgi:hypothetical protein